MFCYTNVTIHSFHDVTCYSFYYTCGANSKIFAPQGKRGTEALLGGMQLTLRRQLPSLLVCCLLLHYRASS